MPLRYPTGSIPSKRAAAFYLFYFGVLGVVLPFLGPYLKARGISAVGIGLITAAFSLAKVAYTPLLGAAVDRGLWFRGILTLHLAVSVGAALVVRSVVADVRLLVVTFFLVGVGYGTVLPLVEATILERLPQRTYGLVRLWGSLGFVVAAAVASPIVARGIETAFPILVAATLALLWISCMPFERIARPPAATSSVPLPGAVWVLLALLTLHQVAHGPYYAFLSIHLESAGFSSLAVGMLWSLGVVAELIAFLAGSVLERRFGLRRILALALLLSPVRWLLLALPPSMPLLVLAQAGHAVTFALVHLAGVQLVQGNVAEGARRNAQALYSGLSFGLGVVVGSALAGPVYARCGGAGSFLSAAALSVTLFFAWLPISGKLREG
jgi:PPP family 3-phenylpropionic acid transporter